MELDQTKNYTKIQVLSGKFLNNKDPLGKMDPYFIISCDDHKFESTVKHSAGLEASWKDEMLVLPTDNLKVGARVKFQAMDYDLLSANDPIGSTEVSLEFL